MKQVVSSCEDAHLWADEFPGAITVCDTRGIIMYMNTKSAKVFERYGGLKLIGKNVLDCHPGPARTKLRKMLKNRTANAYTIAKKGVKKLIYQSPWYEKGRYKGFVELSLEIPVDIPHFLRGRIATKTVHSLPCKGLSHKEENSII